MGKFSELCARYFFIALMLLIGLSTKWASASSYRMVPWQEQAVEADFMGVVECVTAGGIVAEFKVLEAWKGKPDKETISIQMAVDSFGPQFPIALCGDQFVVMAHTGDSPTQFYASQDIPLWWRNIPSDYVLFHGEALPIKDGGIRHYSEDVVALEKFKEQAAEFLNAAPEEQELKLLRTYCEASLFGYGLEAQRFHENAITTQEMLESFLEWQRFAQGASTLEELLNVLLNPPTKLRWSIEFPHELTSSISYSARDRSLEILRAIESKGAYAHPAKLSQIIAEIENRISSSNNWRLEPDSTVFLSEGTVVDLKSVDSETLVRVKRYFIEHQGELDRVSPEYAVLCEYDPEFILDFLVDWSPPNGAIRFINQEYPLASYFCRHSTGDRIKNLNTLLAADNAYKKVAAATYLGFEDSSLATKHLAKFSELEGDPGVWAALGMLSRGDKQYMSRALRVFNTPVGVTMGSINHGNLQKRLLVLISNSCSKSGIPMPELIIADENVTPVPREEIHAFNLAWWESVKDIITIYDPWFIHLARQKVD